MTKLTQIRSVRFADAANGRKTGDRTGVGFFIPLPDALAAQYPSLGTRTSPHLM